MKWYFEPHHDRDDLRNGDDSAPGIDGFPSALLQRHGARVLRPADAALVSGWPVPRSTVYRARTLLVPGGMEPMVTGSANTALAQVGMSLVYPPENDAMQASPAGEFPGVLPRRAVLVPAAASDAAAARPVVVDAWVALQALRAAATAGVHKDLDVPSVSQISLERVLTGSAITGSPVTDGGGLTGSPVTGGGGVTGPTSTDSYMYGGCDARIPVEVGMDAPARGSWDHCALRYGRRPVVAVLDTGVREHPWLDVYRDPSAPGAYRTVLDGFVAVDQGMQDVIHQQGQQAAGSGDQPRQLIRYPWDVSVTAELVGELDTHTGHGTFIAGIVRQIVPDAQVLSVRIMHSDGIVYEHDLICALSLLASRVAAALNGDMSQMVDVLSLSLGYFSETPADQAYSSSLWQVIDSLLSMGVVVTAAAGNYSTSREYYPAAFAELAPELGQAPLISVGALNPNGSKALFSDGGRWIRAWASGAGVISTFPTDVNGSRDPEISMPAYPANEVPPEMGLPSERAALDPDDYASGFAIWSGTSFSGPKVAAEIAKEMLAGAAGDDGLRLDTGGADAAVTRVTHALKNLGWPG